MAIPSRSSVSNLKISAVEPTAHPAFAGQNDRIRALLQTLGTVAAHTNDPSQVSHSLREMSGGTAKLFVALATLERNTMSNLRRAIFLRKSRQGLTPRKRHVVGNYYGCMVRGSWMY